MSLLTEKFFWKSCKVKLLWEVSGSSFSQPGWKYHTLCEDFACLPSPGGSHPRDQPGQKEGKGEGAMGNPPGLPSLIQQIRCDPPKCIHMGICNSCRPPWGNRARASLARLCPGAYPPVQRARSGRAPATALSNCCSCQIYHLMVYIFCHKGDSVP